MISLVAIILLPLLAFALSTNRGAISKRTVIGAFLLQAGLGGLILYVPLGKEILAALAEKVVALLGFSRAGIEFLFGSLVNEDSGFIFAINVLPVIIFFFRQSVAILLTSQNCATRRLEGHVCISLIPAFKSDHFQ